MPLADVAWAVNDLTSRAPTLTRRRNYYEGKHDPVLPDGKSLSPHLRALLDDLNDNLCDDVVDGPLDRLKVTNWSGRSAGQGQAATEAWETTRGPARMREVWRNAFGQGDGWVIVQRNELGQVRDYAQRPDHMAARYSTENPDVIEVAAKAWRQGKRWRMNLYYSPTAASGAKIDRPTGVPEDKPWVERYITRGTGIDGSMPQAKAFSPVVDADDAGADVDTLEGPRIPVFHYPTEEVGRYGRSVLTDVIPLQDVLNKSVVDLVVSMEAVSLPQRWGTGIQVERDPTTGEEIPLFRTGAEKMLRTGNKEARFGQFDAADLRQLLDVQQTYRLEIARKGKLPLHSVSLDATAQAPSGLSLLVAEGALVKRVGTAQDDWEWELREQMAYHLTLAGTPTLATDLDVEWEPPQTDDEATLMATLTTKVESLGLPKREALIEAGYDPKDVDVWLDAAQAQADAISGGRTSLPGPPSGLLPPAPAQANRPALTTV